MEPPGAKVEGVALGFRAFEVETAEGAALGLCALGLTDEAAALGLEAFGPVAAGAEPGVGMKTPCAIAAPAKMRAAQTVKSANIRLNIEDMASSRGTGPREPALELKRSGHDEVAIDRRRIRFRLAQAWSAELDLGRNLGAARSLGSTNQRSKKMRNGILAAGAALALLAAPIAAQAQSGGGAATGAAAGAVGGAVVGGPVGAVVGAGIGAIAGGIGDAQQPEFRQYVVQQGVPSYRYNEEVRVGAVLPSSGVTYYEVPASYGVKEYRYTRVNDRVVLVDPRTHRVVQVIQ
jgi:hypothetical protein